MTRMSLYKNKYRTESARCPSWDYTSNGYYFVTICTQNREYFFGDIIANQIELSPIGKIVAEEWQKTPQIRSYVQLDEGIIMPNHLHGIIIIQNLLTSSQIEMSQHETFSSDFSTKSRLKPKSLGSIIGQFKMACTKQIWKAGFHDFKWQDRFYDHIIRDDESLHSIREYIINNPMKWELDKNNPANLYM
jgi:putative transposase